MERWLVFWLRLDAGVLLLALLAVFFPFRWMAWVNDAFGMRPLEDTPLVNYLTRSLSLLYAYHGALLGYASLDVRRHRRMIAFLGVANVAFGVGMFLLDALIGMPPIWILLEGPAVCVGGAGILLFLRLSTNEN
jgi:hypothetical protein